jgi:hypothetical protein
MGALVLTPSGALAQVNPESALPKPRLAWVMPPGGQAGTTVEVAFGGTDVEEPEQLIFSDLTIRAAPVRAEARKNTQTSGSVNRFKVTIPAATAVGRYDVRLVNHWGVSNSRSFVVGDLPEAVESEPNDEAEQAQRVSLNSTVNGTISAATDVDYYVFAGRAGQRVLLTCQAATIDSRLHPALELYDRAGRMLAVNHRYQGADAILDHTLGADADYVVRLHESTYLQGDAEHYYRLTISTGPWIDAVFPPMVEAQKPARVTVYGRNLPGGQPDPTAVLDGQTLEKIVVTVTPPADPAARHRLQYGGLLPPEISALDGFEFRVRNAACASNPFLITYAQAPVVLEGPAHNSPAMAQPLLPPCEVAGRIEKRHDRDWYAFPARKDQQYSIELISERLGFDTDMYLRVRDPATRRELGEFDDTADTLSPTKFFTRTNDPPRYRFVAPTDGTYLVLVSSRDADVRGGPRQLYRLRITPEEPDFRLIVLPPSDTRPDAGRLFQDGNQYYTVLAWRLDGWNGSIMLKAEGLPAGVTCPPQAIGPGLRQTALVLSASPDAPATVAPIRIQGTAVINGRTVMHEARPASIIWAVQPNQNIPTLSRLDRSLVLAVRPNCPYRLSARLDDSVIQQGGQAKLTVHLARRWSDVKAGLQAAPVDLPADVTVHNRQPLTIPADKSEATVALTAGPKAVPGDYNLVMRGSAEIPFSKDPATKNKPKVNVVQVAAPIVLTILPRIVASLEVPKAVVSRAGNDCEVLVKLARMYDYAGEFKLQLVLPDGARGFTAPDVTVPPGGNQGRLWVHVASDAEPGLRQGLLVKATAAMAHGHMITQTAPLSIKVMK